MEGVVKHWNGLRGDVGESPPLEMFRKCVQVALEDRVGWGTWCCCWLKVGLDDPFQP